MANKTIACTLQKWGNSLAVRIPATIARSAHFHTGTEVELMLQGTSVIVKPTGQRKLTLEERLNLFDPTKHGGEVMGAGLIGEENLK